MFASLPLIWPFTSSRFTATIYLLSCVLFFQPTLSFPYAEREPCSKTLWMPQSPWQMKKRLLLIFPTTPSGRKSSCNYLVLNHHFFLHVISLTCVIFFFPWWIVCLSPAGPWWWQAVTCQPSPSPGRYRARWVDFIACTWEQHGKKQNKICVYIIKCEVTLRSNAKNMSISEFILDSWAWDDSYTVVGRGGTFAFLLVFASSFSLSICLLFAWIKPLSALGFFLSGGSHGRSWVLGTGRSREKCFGPAAYCKRHSHFTLSSLSLDRRVRWFCLT